MRIKAEYGGTYGQVFSKYFHTAVEMKSFFNKNPWCRYIKHVEGEEIAVEARLRGFR